LKRFELGDTWRKSLWKIDILAKFKHAFDRYAESVKDGTGGPAQKKWQWYEQGEFVNLPDVLAELAQWQYLVTELHCRVLEHEVLAAAHPDHDVSAQLRALLCCM
jgi:hypothetical protein